MLLREAQVLLRTHTSSLTPDLQGLGGSQVNFVNRDGVREAVKALSSIPSLNRLATTALRQEGFQAPTTVIENKAANAIRDALTLLVNACTPVAAFLNAVLSPEPEFYVAVKLPPKDDGATDRVSKALNVIHIALDQPLRRLGYEPLKISLVQPGSVWVEIAAATGAGLGILGSILTFAITKVKLTQERIRLDAEKAKALQEQAKLEQEKLKVESEQARAEQERLKLALARLETRKREFELKAQIQQLRTDQAISEFIASHAASAETEAALRMGIDETVNFFEQGAEFRLQLDAPPNVSEYFPKEALPSRFGVPAKQIAGTSDLPKLPTATEFREV